MLRARTIVVAALAAPLVACGGDDPTGPALCTDDTGTVTVTVSDATPPVFSWDPACSVAVFLIEAPGDVWYIGSDDTLWDDPAQANVVTPPVTYGVVPSEVEEFTGPLPLTPGVAGTVILWRILPDGSTASCLFDTFGAFGNVCVLAIHEFIP